MDDVGVCIVSGLWSVGLGWVEGRLAGSPIATSLRKWSGVMPGAICVDLDDVALWVFGLGGTCCRGCED